MANPSNKKYYTDAERKAAGAAKSKRWRDRNPEKARAANAAQQARNPGRSRRTKYGITPEAFAWMLEQQGGACARIGCDRDATDVDHDHTDGHVRGLLCNRCNLAFGVLGDTAASLLRSQQYLASQEPA